MQYRKFGRSGVEVSGLGFGMMRLPILDGDSAKIDEEKTAEMVHYAVGQGVNYIDTAYSYHREQSEIVVGKVLKQGLRERVYLATKCPVWQVKSRADFDSLLDTQLKKIQSDHIDMYLLHGLNKDRWPTLVDANVFGFLDKAKLDGRIRFAGYSFHDDVATFKTIVESYGWDFCQIQFNYMDEHFQAGVEGLRYASRKGMAVVVMEPLRGGRLVKNVPPAVQAVWDTASVKRSPAEWGLRWVWNHPEVSVVLSGMGAMEQVKENIRTAQTAFPNSLTAEELTLFDKVREAYRSRVKIPCTKCEYCQPCPQGIKIPDLFEYYNNAHMYNSVADLARHYDRLKSEAGDIASCAGCGSCEEKCPQNLPVRQLLKELHAELTRKT
jgi:hypothetical protein